MHPGSVLYCQGNGWLALREYEKAKDTLLAALAKLDDPRLSGLTAPCCKNLGSAFEELKDGQAAARYYERALELDPELSEAHFAMAQHLLRSGKDFPAALAHLDAITKRPGSSVLLSSVHGWRIEPLFETGDTAGAFREIHNLLADAKKLDWAWPWCAKQVSRFGRVSLDATRKSADFWRKYLLAHPGHLAAERHLLFCNSQLHMNGESTGVDFEGFKAAAVRLIECGDPDSALLWDRVGHWAQSDHKWEKAETAYRKAFELEPDRYGYCLGTALNFRDKHAEALPILLAQAETHLPDAMSWFQVAIAREGVGDIPGTIAAYERALELDPDYELAWFNLGGVFLNSGDTSRAVAAWREAVSRFPEHPQTTRLREEFPLLFRDDEGGGAL